MRHKLFGVTGIDWIILTIYFVCVLGVGAATSLLRLPARAAELTGLVYSLTPRPRLEPLAWYARPSVLAGTALATTLVINLLLW